MNAACPHCRAVYRLDPAKVPSTGVRARCAECGGVFLVGRPPPAESGTRGPAASAEGDPPAFGPSDPHTRARRLARALASDIVAYHPERWERSLREETLRHEFREEVLRSWEGYVAQVGEEMARTTPYFREALNETLARGAPVF